MRRNSPWGNSDNTSNHPVTELSPRKLPVPFRQQLWWKRERREGRYRKRLATSHGESIRFPCRRTPPLLPPERSFSYRAYLGSNAGGEVRKGDTFLRMRANRMSLSKWPFLVLFAIVVRKSAVDSRILYFTTYYLIGYRRERLRESKFLSRADNGCRHAESPLSARVHGSPVKRKTRRLIKVSGVFWRRRKEKEEREERRLRKKGAAAGCGKVVEYKGESPD